MIYEYIRDMKCRSRAFRFAGDLEDVELSLFQCLREWLQCFLQLLVIFTVICIKVPLFGILIIPLGIVYYRIQVGVAPESLSQTATRFATIPLLEV